MAKELKGLPKSPDYIRQKRREAAVRIGSFVFILIICLIIGILLFRSARPTVYTIADGRLQISTEFGESIDLSDIEKVQINNEMPQNLSKINGLDLGSILKGEFKTDGNRIHVYVDASKPPFLYVYTKNELIIANGATKDETLSLYQKLQARK